MQHNLDYRQGYWKALTDFADWINYHSIELRANRVPIHVAENLATLFAENVTRFMELGREAPVSFVKDKQKYHSFTIGEAQKTHSK